MPFTPFVGLSVMVHLVIVLYYRIHQPAGFNGIVGFKSHNAITRVSRFFSVLIVFGVFVLVSTIATFLVGASLFDKHSTVSYVSQEANEIISHNQIISRVK